MQAAGFSLVTNILVAGLFAASYVTIALLYPGRRAPIWFAAAYGVGMLTPVAQLGLAYSGWSAFFWVLVYLSFTGGLLLLAPALAVFYNARPPWRLASLVLLIAFMLMPFLVFAEPATLLRELAYQTPFILSVGLSLLVVWRNSPRYFSDYLLAAMLCLLLLHFPVKAYIASQIGTGHGGAAGYIESTYALISQVASGGLLMATGLVLLIKCL